jgi:hypothetical protein
MQISKWHLSIEGHFLYLIKRNPRKNRRNLGGDLEGFFWFRVCEKITLQKEAFWLLFSDWKSNKTVCWFLKWIEQIVFWALKI